MAARLAAPAAILPSRRIYRRPLQPSCAFSCRPSVQGLLLLSALPLAAPDLAAHLAAYADHLLPSMLGLAILGTVPAA